MDKRIVFQGDLMHMASSIDEAIAELTLPAMPWALQDAIERAHLDDGEPMYIDLADYTDFPYLEPYLEDANDLYALNALTEKLAALEPWQMDALEGLVLMEKEKHEPFGLPRIYDLAASAGECQVLYEATSDEALGRFYVDNGFIPSMTELPESIFEVLDYRKIGEEMRKGEGGVFLRYGYGYVTQVGELKEEYKTLDLTPKEPEYSVLLEVAVPDTDRRELVRLPCGKEELSAVPERLGVTGWHALSWRCADCRIPALRDAFSTTDNIAFIHLAARQLAEIPKERIKGVKAILESVQFRDLNEAVALLDRAGEYIFTPKFDTPAAVARRELVFMLGEEDAALAFPYVNLSGYGQKLMEAHNQVMTAYGVVERADNQPVRTAPEQQGEQRQEAWGGMEMI